MNPETSKLQHSRYFSVQPILPYMHTNLDLLLKLVYTWLYGEKAKNKVSMAVYPVFILLPMINKYNGMKERKLVKKQ